MISGVKNLFLNILRARGYKLQRYKEEDKWQKTFREVYNKYRVHTMIPEQSYTTNLLLCKRLLENIDGDVAECGVWKGGMTAGITEILGKNRNYYLFDSFEGLPPAMEIDGASAAKWQNDKAGDTYYNNCSAEETIAYSLMQKVGVPHKIMKGWFNDTLPLFNETNKLALLRLDGDWYESTMICLKALYPKVVDKGLIIIDDYYAWDGCSRAVHDYLSSINSPARIRALNGVCYILKPGNG